MQTDTDMLPDTDMQLVTDMQPDTDMHTDKNHIKYIALDKHAYL